LGIPVTALVWLGVSAVRYSPCNRPSQGKKRISFGQGWADPCIAPKIQNQIAKGVNWAQGKIGPKRFQAPEKSLKEIAGKGRKGAMAREDPETEGVLKRVSMVNSSLQVDL